MPGSVERRRRREPLNPNNVAAGPPYAGLPRPKSRRWNPTRRLSNTRNRFASAMQGQQRSASRSSVDRTYSALTAALAALTSATASPSGPAVSAPAVVSEPTGMHALL
ncbi:hypothetical protein BS78_09G038500 [Paspalum vaginatum]|nr:hypothetical protein BS78_09G038500 [Paspalum vaginatum]